MGQPASWRALRARRAELGPNSAKLVRLEAILPNPKPKLMDQMREVMRLRHYSIHTERSCWDWIRRYVKLHRMKSRAELFPATGKVEVFLSDLAVNGRVTASTLPLLDATMAN